MPLGTIVRFARQVEAPSLKEWRDLNAEIDKIMVTIGNVRAEARRVADRLVRDAGDQWDADGDTGAMFHLGAVMRTLQRRLKELLDAKQMWTAKHGGEHANVARGRGGSDHERRAAQAPVGQKGRSRGRASRR